jgi:outer membrane protein assembly factor BamB
MPLRRHCLPSLLLGLATVAWCGAGEAPYPGFRGDRNGYFADCSGLPSTWSETQNVVWRTQLPGWSHGEVLLVKGKLYAMGEHEAEKNPAQIGPDLYCVDPESGKLLWSKPQDHYDLTAEPEKVREAWTAQQRMVAELEAYRTELIAAAGGYAAAKMKPKEDEIIQQLKTRFGAYKQISGTGPSLKFERGSDAQRRADYLGKNNAWYTAWCPPQTPHVGYAMSSPVSDGERIYFRTAHHVLHCVDLDGKRLWAAIISRGNGGGDAHLTTPLVIDGTVIVYTARTRRRTPLIGPWWPMMPRPARSAGR